MKNARSLNYEVTDLKFGNFMWETKEGQIINAIAYIVDFSIFDEDEIIGFCRQSAHLENMEYKIIIY